MRSSLFIGIPCYQESETLKKTLASLARSTKLEHHLEVQVAQQSVVQNKNELLKKARLTGAEYICLCDDDVEPELAWDEKLIQGIEEVEARAKRRVGQTSPLFLYPDNRVCWSAWVNVRFKVAPDEQSILGMAYGLPLSDLYRVKLEAGALTGALTIFKREFLEGISWEFDDRYEKSQYEDVDQSLTCRSEGYIALYNGTVTVIHHVAERNPRAADDNYQKLLKKWAKRVDLSLEIPLERESILQAQERLYVADSSLWSKCTKILRLVRERPFQRFRTSLRILRRSGMKGLLYQWRYKMKEH